MGFLAQEGFSYNGQKDKKSSYFSADVTERKIARSPDYQAQREEYIGKQKQLAVKNLVIYNEAKEIISFNELYEGSVHDKNNA